MNVSLRPEFWKFVEAQVRSGQYASAEDVVHAALLALQAREDPPAEHSAEDIELLRDEIAVGLAQSERGESQEWDADEIRAEAFGTLPDSKKKAV